MSNTIKFCWVEIIDEYQAIDRCLVLSEWEDIFKRKRFIELFKSEENDPNTKLSQFIKTLQREFPDRREQLIVWFIWGTISDTVYRNFSNNTTLEKYSEEWKITLMDLNS